MRNKTAENNGKPIQCTSIFSIEAKQKKHLLTWIVPEFHFKPHRMQLQNSIARFNRWRHSLLLTMHKLVSALFYIALRPDFIFIYNQLSEKEKVRREKCSLFTSLLRSNLSSEVELRRFKRSLFRPATFTHKHQHKHSSLNASQNSTKLFNEMRNVTVKRIYVIYPPITLKKIRSRKWKKTTYKKRRNKKQTHRRRRKVSCVITLRAGYWTFLFFFRSKHTEQANPRTMRHLLLCLCVYV